MQIAELTAQALAAYQAKQNLILVLPSPWKQRPRGFPRGELLCTNKGSSVYSYDPMKVLGWLHKNGLIKVTLDEQTQNELSREA